MLNKTRFPSPGGAQGDSLPVDDPLEGNEKGVYSAYTPIKRLSLNIETRDALSDATSRQQLLEGGGEIKVPCLRITREDGNVEWMYESNEIISYLNENFA